MHLLLHQPQPQPQPQLQHRVCLQSAAVVFPLQWLKWRMVALTLGISWHGWLDSLLLMTPWQQLLLSGQVALHSAVAVLHRHKGDWGMRRQVVQARKQLQRLRKVTQTFRWKKRARWGPQMRQGMLPLPQVDLEAVQTRGRMAPAVA